MSWLNLQDYLKGNAGEGVRMQKKVEKGLKEDRSKIEEDLAKAGDKATTNATKLGRDSMGNYTVVPDKNASQSQIDAAKKKYDATLASLDAPTRAMIEKAQNDPKMAKQFEDAIAANAGQYGADNVPLARGDGVFVNSGVYQKAMKDLADAKAAQDPTRYGPANMLEGTQGVESNVDDTLGGDAELNKALAAAGAFGNRLGNFKTTAGTSNEINKAYGGGGMLDALLYRQDPSMNWGNKYLTEGAQASVQNGILPENFSSMDAFNKKQAALRGTNKLAQQNQMAMRGTSQNTQQGYAPFGMQQALQNTYGSQVEGMTNAPNMETMKPTKADAANNFNYDANSWSTKYNKMLDGIKNKWSANYNTGKNAQLQDANKSLSAANYGVTQDYAQQGKAANGVSWGTSNMQTAPKSAATTTAEQSVTYDPNTGLPMGSRKTKQQTGYA